MPAIPNYLFRKIAGIFFWIFLAMSAFWTVYEIIQFLRIADDMRGGDIFDSLLTFAVFLFRTLATALSIKWSCHALRIYPQNSVPNKQGNPIISFCVKSCDVLVYTALGVGVILGIKTMIDEFKLLNDFDFKFARALRLYFEVICGFFGFLIGLIAVSILFKAIVHVLKYAPGYGEDGNQLREGFNAVKARAQQMQQSSSQQQNFSSPPQSQYQGQQYVNQNPGVPFDNSHPNSQVNQMNQQNFNPPPSAAQFSQNVSGYETVQNVEKICPNCGNSVSGKFCVKCGARCE